MAFKISNIFHKVTTRPPSPRFPKRLEMINKPAKAMIRALFPGSPRRASKTMSRRFFSRPSNRVNSSICTSNNSWLRCWATLESVATCSVNWIISCESAFLETPPWQTFLSSAIKHLWTNQWSTFKMPHQRSRCARIISISRSRSNHRKIRDLLMRWWARVSWAGQP